MIPYGRHDIRQEDIEAVVRVLQSNFLTQGTGVPEFEKAVAEYCGVPYAVAVNSGTSALHVACLALGVGVGDIVWTSPVSFLASANCALYCGADVDFVDIDIHTSNMSIDALERKLYQAEKNKALPKVVLPVHFAGNPCDMKGIYALSLKYGFSIIEDGCHALGGKYVNQAIGSCAYSDVTVFSFHPVKNITTGEGGMAVTKDRNLADKMAMLREHGVTRDSKQMVDIPDGICGYQQLALGFNYRMTDVEAVLGTSQLKRLDDYVARRHFLAARYNDLLKGLPIQCPRANSDGFSGMHLYVIRVQQDTNRKNQVALVDFLQSKGVLVQLHYIPIFLQPLYRKMGFRPEDFPVAMLHYRSAISLPLYPTLTEDQQEQVVNTLGDALLSS